MDELQTSFDQVQTSAVEGVSAFVALLPHLLGAIALLALGWLLARLARRGSVTLTRAVNRSVVAMINKDRRTRISLPTQMPRLVGDVVYWTIILFFVTVAARTAKLEIVSRWLERVVEYVPTLVAGAIIVLVGYLISALVRDIVTNTAATAGIAQHRLVGSVAQAATFLTGLVIGLDQIGMDVTFLVTIIAITLSASLAALSIAFGFGARNFVDNLISARSLQRQYERGQTIRVGASEGEILEITPTSIILSGESGRTMIPARLFNERESILLTPEEADV